MELEIVKVEDGLCTGEVLFHKHVQKSTEEVAEQAERVKSREELREQRRRQQVGPVFNIQFLFSV